MSALITIQIADRVVRATRTAVRIASPAEVEAMTAFTRQTLRPILRPDHALLLDLRQANIADETTHAAAMRAFRRELIPGFRRAVCLVETQVGLLQVQRFLREEGLAAQITTNEPYAVKLLESPT